MALEPIITPDITAAARAAYEAAHPKRQAESAEVSSARRDYQAFESWLGVRDKRDFILTETREGQRYGLELWERMEIDAHIYDALQVRKAGLLSRPWSVQPWDESEAAKAQADFVTQVLNSVNWAQDMQDLLDCVAKGYAVSELLWRVDEHGQWVIGDIRARRPGRFVFGIDGELRRCDRLPRGEQADPVEGTPMPPLQFIVASHEPRYENPYGTAVLSRCFWPWWFKKHGARFWAVFVEKFAAPTVVGKFAPGASTEEKDALLAACDAVATETGVIIPNTQMIELLQALKEVGTSSYEQYCRYWDGQSSKAILGTTLTIDEGQFGTRAQAVTHQEVSALVMSKDARLLEAVTDRQIIQPLIDLNFGPQEGYPYLSIETDTASASKEMAERDEILSGMGVTLSLEDLYERHSVRPPSNEKDRLVAAPAPDPAVPPVPQVAFSEVVTDPERLTDRAVAGLSAPMKAAFEQALNTLGETESYDAAREALYEAFPDIALGDLEESLQRAVFVANLRGRSEVAAKPGGTA